MGALSVPRPADRPAFPAAWWDVGPALGLAVLTVVQLVSDPPPKLPAVAALLALATVAPVAVRRTWPLLAAVVTAAGVALQVALIRPTPPFGSFLAVLLCLYTLGRRATVRSAVLGVLAIYAAVIAVGVQEGLSSPFELVYPVVYFGGAVGVGAAVRARDRRLRRVTDHAERLEREWDQQTRLALAEERARIARELHDVVAHSVSLMVVQAEAAEELVAAAPERAVAPLQRVQETGRGALVEMRRLLGVLRQDELVGAETSPQPGLDGIDALVAEARASGVEAVLCVSGEPHAVPPGVQLVVYRIVQESLTNIRRHARATRATVRLAFSASAVEVEVTDDGAGATGRLRPGHGLIGMRERVSMYGGDFSAGVALQGGFRVHARLPVAEAPA